MAIQQDERKLAARVGHTKSRTGCLKCRTRKVKCDEAKPICANCQRLGLQCQFPSRTQSSTLSRHAERRPLRSSNKIDSDLPTPQSSPASSNRPDCDEDVPRSIGIHMELRLLHALMSRGMLPEIYIGMPARWKRLWYVDVPRLSFDHENLLYALLAFSATQQLGASNRDPELPLAQAEYWSLALRHQRLAFDKPDHPTEATTLAARIISIIAFGMLRDRVLEPYAPPVEWIEISRSVFRVLPRPGQYPPDWTVLRAVNDVTVPAWGHWLRDDMPLIVDEVDMPILNHRWSEELRYYGGDQDKDSHTYRHTLALVTSFRQSVRNRESPQNHVWRVVMFPQAVSDEFLRFVRQKRPRALVIVAACLVVIAQTTILGVFGDCDMSIPKGEIRAIQKCLPEEWQELMIRPLADLAAVDTTAYSFTRDYATQVGNSSAGKPSSASMTLEMAMGSFPELPGTM